MTRLPCLLVLAVLFAWGNPAHAQTPLSLRVVVRADSSAYLYATTPATAGRGFVFSRRSGDTGPFVRLNAAPTRALESPFAFADSAGRTFSEILTRTGQVDTVAAYARLLSDPIAASLFTFQHPAVARALGRLYVDRGVPLGARVTYRVQRVDALDEPSGAPAEVTLVLVPALPPSVQGLAAENRGVRGTLRWQFAPNRRGEDDRVLGFNAYMQTLGGARVKVNDQLVLRDEGTGRYALPFLADSTGQPVVFTVEAVDVTGQAGEPARLPYVPVDNEPPAPVADVAALARPDGHVEVTWPISVEADLAGYVVYRGPSVRDTLGLVRLNAIPLDPFETVFVDANVEAPGARTYAYRVAAVDRAGNEGRKSNAALVAVEDHTPPPAPMGIVATRSASGVDLRWGMELPAPDLATYLVFRRQVAPGAPGVEARINQAPVRAPAYRDADRLEEGATYQFRVSAVDSTNNVSPSDSVRVSIPNVTPPAPPPTVAAEVGPDGRVTVRWSASSSLDVVAYTIARVEGGMTEPVGRALAPATTFTDDEPRIGATYVYAVTAIDAAANRSDPAQSSPARIRDGEPPRVVRNVQVVAGAAGVLVAWEPVPSEDLAGYRVLRSNIATGQYDVVQEVPPGAPGVSLQWTDVAGRAGVWYRVVAVDTSGNKSEAPAPVQAAPLRQ